MTGGAGPGGRGSGGSRPGGVTSQAATERSLRETYRQVIAFAAVRARRGDPAARGLDQAFHQAARPVPARPMVRRWLAGVASEIRLIRPVSDPGVASHLLAAMQARERLVPGSAEQLWQAAVAASRAGGGPPAGPAHPGPR